MDNTVRTHLIDNDDQPDIAFTGTQLAWVSSEGDSPRWTELSLYKTDTDKFVAVSSGISTIAGERTFQKARVFDDKLDVIKFFGFGSLAKELYQHAGIKAAVKV